MQSICLLYATREGRTRRIAEHVAAKLCGRGVAVTVTNVRDHTARNSLNTCTAAILAASVHTGRHEPEILQFVKEHRGELGCLPTAFLSVPLSEAGAEGSDATSEEHAQFVAEAQKVLGRFFAETGWHPERVKPVAGALLYTQYQLALVGCQGLRLTWASEALNSFLRYFKKNSFKEDEGRKIRCDDMVNATPLESNKSHDRCHGIRDYLPRSNPRTRVIKKRSTASAFSNPPHWRPGHHPIRSPTTRSSREVCSSSSGTYKAG